MWQLNISLGNEALFRNHYKTRKSCPTSLAKTHGKLCVCTCVRVRVCVCPCVCFGGCIFLCSLPAPFVILFRSSMAPCFQDNSPPPPTTVSNSALNPPLPPSVSASYPACRLEMISSAWESNGAVGRRHGQL